MIGDPELKVAMLYDMLPAGAADGPAGRAAADNATVRSVFVIGPDKQIKRFSSIRWAPGAISTRCCGCSISLEVTAKHSVATPVNWRPGEDVIIVPPSVSDEAAKQKFPKGGRR